MKKRPTKNPAVQSGAKSKTTKKPVNSTPEMNRVPPRRCVRVMVALLNGPVTREQANRIAPASNGPHYIGILRHTFGMDIPCERVPFVTIDGIASWYGRYHATQADRAVIQALLARMGAANDE